jgi:hypothetical protein
MENNTLHLISFILLIVISISGNILVFNHKNELSKYYDVSINTINIINILNHFILPLILLYYLYNKLKIIPLEKLNNMKITAFIFILILAIIYHILMKFNITGSYGIPYYKSLQYSFISIIIVIIILYIFK